MTRCRGSFDRHIADRASPPARRAKLDGQPARGSYARWVVVSLTGTRSAGVHGCTTAQRSASKRPWIGRVPQQVEGQATARRLVRRCTDRSQYPAARARRTIARAASRRRSSRDRARRRPLAIHQLAAASGGSSLRRPKAGRRERSDRRVGASRSEILVPNGRQRRT